MSDPQMESQFILLAGIFLLLAKASSNFFSSVLLELCRGPQGFYTLQLVKAHLDI